MVDTIQVRSSDPDVQELIDRFNAHQDMDSGIIDGYGKDFMGAVYMEAQDDPEWKPTEHIRDIIKDINARLGAWEKDR